MPYIAMGVPKRDIETKRKLVAGVTNLVSELYGIRREAITIVITESPQENVSVGGVLLADKQR